MHKHEHSRDQNESEYQMCSSVVDLGVHVWLIYVPKIWKIEVEKW